MKRLALARPVKAVLAAELELLLLDEPTAGMSLREIADIIALIARLTVARRLTLLFIEPDVKVVFLITDCVSVFHHGDTVASDTPTRIRSDADVQSVYLGGQRDGPS